VLTDYFLRLILRGVIKMVVRFVVDALHHFRGKRLQRRKVDFPVLECAVVHTLSFFGDLGINDLSNFNELGERTKHNTCHVRVIPRIMRLLSSLVVEELFVCPVKCEHERVGILFVA
jgi:hypothetical protein